MDAKGRGTEFGVNLGRMQRGKGYKCERKLEIGEGGQGGGGGRRRKKQPNG